MDIFRTPVELEATGFHIRYRDNLFLLGSCFTTYIGNRLEALKFHVCNNPFGVLYNPASIAGSLERMQAGNAFTEADLQQQNDLWFSFSHHGSFSNPDKNICLENINTSFETASARLRNCNCLLLTFGTAWVYRYKSTGQIVANCHKIPEREFERFMLTPEEIAQQYGKLIHLLRNSNPGLKLIFTVSPVRHLKDGMVGNQQSKAALHLAIRLIRSELEGCDYFPAYEIMMDDLRDYRFYEADMIHPNAQAIDYIWDKFCDCYFDKETKAIMEEMAKINSAINHRPLHPDTQEFRKFCKLNLSKVEELGKQFPFLDLSAELTYFRQMESLG